MELCRYSEEVQGWLKIIIANYENEEETDRVLDLCNKVLQEGVTKENVDLLGMAYYYAGECYYLQGKFVYYYNCFAKALEYLKKSNEKELLVRAYCNMGIIFFNKGNPLVALDYYLDSLYCSRENNLRERECVANINIGVMYYSCKRYKDARYYLEKALEHIIQHKEAKYYFFYLISIYINQVQCFIKEEYYEDAKEIFEMIYEQYWEEVDISLRCPLWIAEASYCNAVGNKERLDEVIDLIQKNSSHGIYIMDVFAEYREHCQLLLELGRKEELENLLQIIEPLVYATESAHLQLQLISLKVHYMKKFHMWEEYLKTAQLYIEWNEKREEENDELISNVLSVKSSLEQANIRQQEIEKINIELLEKTERDPLTGMLNRNAMERISKALTGQDIVVAFIAIDIDCFKKVNDTYGHKVGDKVLIHVCRLLKQNFKHSDYVIRFGGDEIVVILKECYDKIEESVNSRIQILNQELGRKDGPIPPVSVSAGIAISKNGYQEDMYRCADEALYYVKRHGRCGCKVVWM